MWAVIDVEFRDHSTVMKWFVSACFFVATIIMISPIIASQSPIPWILFLIGNIMWMIDSALHNQRPWFWASVVFSAYDVLLIYSRFTGVDTLVWIRPFVDAIEHFLI